MQAELQGLEKTPSTGKGEERYVRERGGICMRQTVWNDHTQEANRLTLKPGKAHSINIL